MEEEGERLRQRNLLYFGKVENAWYFAYAIIFVTFFPYLTTGTAIHEQVVDMSRYGTVGILLAPIYLWLLRLLLKWYVKTGRNLESLTFVPMVLVGALVGTSISYIILRIFKHDGDWESTFTISRAGITAALLLNFLGVLFLALAVLTIPYYRAGKNVIIRDGKPMPFWQVLVILFSIPFILILGIIASTFLR